MVANVTAAIQEIGPGVRIDPSAEIVAKRLVIGAGAVIEKDVVIRATDVVIGRKTVIQQRCTIKAIGGDAETIRIGDYSMVGNDTSILLPTFSMGDYTSVHNHCLISGYKHCQIGHNGFIGQHSVLNASAELTIGNNFRMALNGYIWTHAESGELLEGCTFYHRTPTVIEDDVWMTGCNSTISPGVRLGKGSIILMGSVVTRDTLPRHCYGGSPARDLTDKLHPYRTLTHAQKIEMMKGFVAEFIETHPEFRAEEIVFVPSADTPAPSSARIVIVENGPARPRKDVSVFSLSEKTYTKQHADIEQQMIRFMVGARARFLPLDAS